MMICPRFHMGGAQWREMKRRWIFPALVIGGNASPDE
jgi:hypothetical protein